MASRDEKAEEASGIKPPSAAHTHGHAHEHTKDTFTGDVEGIRDDFREDDFMTRNGLNLKSFQRRKSQTLVRFVSQLASNLSYR
jgi:amino acid transporter